MISCPEILRIVSIPNKQGYYCPFCSEELGERRDGGIKYTCLQSIKDKTILKHSLSIGYSLSSLYFWIYFGNLLVDILIYDGKTEILITRSHWDKPWAEKNRILELKLDFVIEINDVKSFEKQIETYLLFS
jgi:hypothetical protein